MKLHLSHITKTYGNKTILNDLSYVFDKTGVYVLMGANGCGKSTFLRICALLEQQDSGELAYLDNSTTLAKDITLRRRLTLVLPRTGVFNASVFKNAAYGLTIRGIDHLAVISKVNAVLDFVGLGPKANQQARTLSSGETQRLGIARALVLEPEVLFLDEPTASIDEENTEIIETIINTMSKAGRTTIIMTTHDREQANRVGDVQLVMTSGKIASQDLR